MDGELKLQPFPREKGSYGWRGEIGVILFKNLCNFARSPM